MYDKSIDLKEVEEDSNKRFHYFLELLIDSGFIQYSKDKSSDIYKLSNAFARKKLQSIFDPIFGQKESSKEFYEGLIINEQFGKQF